MRYLRSLAIDCFRTNWELGDSLFGSKSRMEINTKFLFLWVVQRAQCVSYLKKKIAQIFAHIYMSNDWYHVILNDTPYQDNMPSTLHRFTYKSLKNFRCYLYIVTAANARSKKSLLFIRIETCQKFRHDSLEKVLKFVSWKKKFFLIVEIEWHERFWCCDISLC